MPEELQDLSEGRVGCKERGIPHLLKVHPQDVWAPLLAQATLQHCPYLLIKVQLHQSLTESI